MGKELVITKKIIEKKEIINPDGSTTHLKTITKHKPLSVEQIARRKSIATKTKTGLMFLGIGIIIVVFAWLSSPKISINNSRFPSLAEFLPDVKGYPIFNFIFFTFFTLFLIGIGIMCILELNECFLKSNKHDANFITIFTFCLFMAIYYVLYSLIFYFKITIDTQKGKLGLEYILFAFILFLPFVFLCFGIIPAEKNKKTIIEKNRVLYVFTLGLILFALNGVAFCIVSRNFVVLLIIIFICAMCDTGGYFFGMLWGKHKMSPIISPKKTWEGAIGGQVLSILFTLGLLGLCSINEGESNFKILSDFFGNQITGGWKLLDTGNTKWIWWVSVIPFILLLGIVSVYGDLLFSLIKRRNNMKDFSNLFPGHGGILDRVDSIILTVAIYFVICIISGFICNACDLSVHLVNPGWKIN